MADSQQEQLPRIFKWFREQRIAASGFPEGRAELEATRNQCITHSVAVTRREPDQEAAQQLGIHVDHVSGISADLAALDRAVESVHQAVGEGKSVLVH